MKKETYGMGKHKVTINSKMKLGTKSHERNKKGDHMGKTFTVIDEETMELVTLRSVSTLRSKHGGADGCPIACYFKTKNDGEKAIQADRKEIGRPIANHNIVSGTNARIGTTPCCNYSCSSYDLKRTDKSDTANYYGHLCHYEEVSREPIG